MAWDIINGLCRLYGSSKPKPCLVTANAVACRKKKSREFKPNTRNEVNRKMKWDQLPSTCHKCFFRISHPGTAYGRHPMPGNLIWYTQSYIIYVILNHTLYDGSFVPWHPNTLNTCRSNTDIIDGLYQTIQGHPTSIFGKYLFGRRFEI